MPADNTVLDPVEEVDLESAPDHTFGDDTAKRLISAALVFLVIGAALSALTVFQIAEPRFLGGIAFLSYGRLFPAATNLILYGWLTLGFIGAAYVIVPRLSGVELQRRSAAMAALALVGLGVVAGFVAVLLGLNQGRRFAEAPLWAAAIVLVGLLGAAISLTATAARSKVGHGAPVWFIVAGSWWLVLVHGSGNLPGYNGVNSGLQASFHSAGLIGLWLAAVGVGVIYYLIPAIADTKQPPPTRLAVIGFWSFAFAWAGTGPRAMQFGPSADWIETVAVLFSIGLVLPVMVIAGDYLRLTRGRWGDLLSSVAFRFAFAGVVLFLTVPIVNLALAFRSASAITGLTDWVIAYDYITLFGAFSLWLIAFVYHFAGERGATGLHFWGTLVGLAIAVSAALVSGTQAGLTWVADANTLELAPVGEAFRNTSVPLRDAALVRGVGLGLFALAQIPFTAAVFNRRRSLEEATDPGAEVPEELVTEPISLGRVLQGATGLFVLAALLVWWLPSLEASHRDATLLGDEVRVWEAGTAEAAGYRVYVQEGCWYCHTQQVRAIVTDVGLGPVSAGGDYVYEAPAPLGLQRIGPDLMHVGSREPTDSADWVLSYLQGPRSQRPWSTMPAYSHLSESDLVNLSLYIAALD